ncbi:cytochrome c [Geobacter sp. SVR]|uniref:c-type cytochrome n=1 Tax=Geobacter sp. SVR TaxID=2495594 RepID=UPI00143F0074|nr:cytochrome c [Geobacter sp. SVR]BCS52977.1 cytochrome c [Geobacter sp. SVR]GCF84361.1 cytochrome c [Geobacter sp. SVR]
MKRALTLIAAFAAVALLTVAAQAENKGEQIFAQKCAMCHKANGKGGAIGPDLSKISARMKEQDLKGKLENPKKSNPSSSMPSFKTLPKADMDALVGYLKTLK